METQTAGQWLKTSQTLLTRKVKGLNSSEPELFPARNLDETKLVSKCRARLNTKEVEREVLKCQRDLPFLFLVGM